MKLRQPKTLDDLAALTTEVRDLVSQALQGESVDFGFGEWRDRIERQLCRDLDAQWWADSLAQVVVCGEWSVRLSARTAAQRNERHAADDSAPDERQLVEFLRKRLAILVPAADSRSLSEIAERVRAIDFEPLMDGLTGAIPGDPVIHGYERFLTIYDSQSRTRSGVYYTPTAVVRFLLQSADEMLRREFGLPLGLADDRSWRAMRERHPQLGSPPTKWDNETFVRILDPACGTGAFLAELFAQLHHRMTGYWLARECPPHELPARWSAYVESHVLSRVVGFEVMMAPWAIAHVRLAAALATTGCWLRDDQQLRIYLTDTLADPNAGALFRDDSLTTCDDSSGTLTDAKCREPMTVVIGNPPYAGISDNRDRWIRNLLRGKCPEDPRRQSYYHVDGEPLGERKLWLADDYVKFLRYGQWRIDRAGAGIVAFVTNHGYLDNSTFRGARQSLMQSFSHISLVDLHGNVKKRERRRDAMSDESVFATEQGMAVGLFSNLPNGEKHQDDCRISRGDLWGTAEKKREVLQTSTASQIALNQLTPAPPDYVFVERDATYQPEYEAGYRLPDIMPVGTTAVVTARDRLVVDFTSEELLTRIQRLRDPSVADDVIRSQCFSKRRSPKYPTGDTRGWKLADARRRLHDDDLWRDRVTTCLYRPFDCRSIYWMEGMIDWPRTEVMRHLSTGVNVALIARRQMLAGHECNYFWVTDRITIDGVIRSDNRGSESVFPLFLTGGNGPPTGRQVNFSEAFVRACEKTLPGRPIVATGGCEAMAAPLRWLGYFYAQFHSPTYRRRYADLLRADFPRVFLTPHEELWDEMSDLGCQLMATHLDTASPARALFGPNAVDSVDDQVATGRVELVASGPVQVGRGHPKFELGRVRINPEAHFGGVSEDVWRFCVGGHQVCRKWLKDRRGRTLDEADVARYAHMVGAVAQTIRLASQIDRAIEKRGGWPVAFAAEFSGD